MFNDPHHLLGADRGPILSVWAHPDDETYLAGGLMAQAVIAGRRVVCVSATAGERGTDDPARWTPRRLARLRRWERGAAMDILGVVEHTVLGLPDGALGDIDDDRGIAIVAELIDTVRPALTVTFGPDGFTLHPDHQAISRWTTAAWERTGRCGQLLHTAVTTEQLERFGALYERWGIYMSTERPRPIPESTVDVHLRLSESLLDRKVAALRAMASQTAGAVSLLGEAQYRRLQAEETFVIGAGVRRSVDRRTFAAVP